SDPAALASRGPRAGGSARGVAAPRPARRRRRRTADAESRASRHHLLPRRQHRLEGLAQLPPELLPRLLHLREERRVLVQQFLGDAMLVAAGVRVLQAQLVSPRAGRLRRDAQGDVVLDPGVPPRLLRLELLDPDRLRLAVALLPRRVAVLVVPDLLRRTALREEEQVP